jgi:hypothetical protein
LTGFSFVRLASKYLEACYFLLKTRKESEKISLAESDEVVLTYASAKQEGGRD